MNQQTVIEDFLAKTPRSPSFLSLRLSAFA
jgi:hypothetical protein